MITAILTYLFLGVLALPSFRYMLPQEPLPLFQGIVLSASPLQICIAVGLLWLFLRIVLAFVVEGELSRPKFTFRGVFYLIHPGFWLYALKGLLEILAFRGTIFGYLQPSTSTFAAIFLTSLSYLVYVAIAMKIQRLPVGLVQFCALFVREFFYLFVQLATGSIWYAFAYQVVDAYLFLNHLTWMDQQGILVF